MEVLTGVRADCEEFGGAAGGVGKDNVAEAAVGVALGVRGVGVGVVKRGARVGGGLPEEGGAALVPSGGVEVLEREALELGFEVGGEEFVLRYVVRNARRSWWARRGRSKGDEQGAWSLRFWKWSLRGSPMTPVEGQRLSRSHGGEAS